jgi:hypothetical protein
MTKIGIDFTVKAAASKLTTVCPAVKHTSKHRATKQETNAILRLDQLS